MELQNTVKEALNALYHHPDDAVRMQADRWLQDFQRTIDAWQVSDNLLHDASSNQETLIFCSQTLRSKVQRDFEELPSEAFRPLRDSLNRLIFDEPEDGVRKIVLATNIAETSITINDVVFVIDCGKAKETSYDALNNTPCLLPSWISKVSAKQAHAGGYMAVFHVFNRGLMIPLIVWPAYFILSKGIA